MAVQAIWDLFYATGRWPLLGEVARKLDRLHDVVLEDTLPEVPRELVHGVDPRYGAADNQRVGLTVAGAASVAGSHEELEAFVAAVRLAAEMDKAWDPPPGSPDAQPQLTSQDLVGAVALPAAGREHLLARVGALLRNENWGWTSATGDESTTDWSFSVSRRVRIFRGVRDVADYWARAHPATSAEADVIPLELTDEPTQETVFVPVNTSAPAGRTVFLVHGRDHAARSDVIDLLRAFDLRVINWRDAATAAGGGTPYTGDIVRAGMEMADAVVVLLTPDDVGYVRPTFRQERDGRDELQPTGQARLNVIFEAGMAMMRDRNRVVLLEVGATRSLSDTAGLNLIRLRDDIEVRKDLAARLRAAGLAVDTDTEAWRSAGRFDRPALMPSDLMLPGGDETEARATDAETLVLRHLAAHFDRPNTHRLDTPFDVPGLDWDRVVVTLRDLYRSDPPYIEGVPVAEADYPVVVTGLTERGRKAARAG